MHKVFITRNWHPNAVNLLSKYFEVKVWNKSRIPSTEEIIENASDCFAIFTEFDDKINSKITQMNSGRQNPVNIFVIVFEKEKKDSALHHHQLSCRYAYIYMFVCHLSLSLSDLSV